MIKSLPNFSVLTTEFLFSSSGYHINMLQYTKFAFFSWWNQKYFVNLQYSTVYIALGLITLRFPSIVYLSRIKYDVSSPNLVCYHNSTVYSN